MEILMVKNKLKLWTDIDAKKKRVWLVKTDLFFVLRQKVLDSRLI